MSIGSCRSRCWDRVRSGKGLLGDGGEEAGLGRLSLMGPSAGQPPTLRSRLPEGRGPRPSEGAEAGGKDGQPSGYFADTWLILI